MIVEEIFEIIISIIEKSNVWSLELHKILYEALFLYDVLFI